jgi:hypothetical protein
MSRDSSFQAQAILRAIENEAQARRRRIDEDRSRHAQANTGDQPAIGAHRTTDLRDAADRLMALVDHVVAHTEGVRTRVREVEQSLDLLSEQLAAAALAPLPPEPAVEVAPPAPPPAPLPPEPVFAAPEPPPPPASPAPVAAPTTPEPSPLVEEAAIAREFDGARLMAIEMAVAGSSRGEVGERLSRDFDITDPSLILDDVFGEGAPDDSRMPWTS